MFHQVVLRIRLSHPAGCGTDSPCESVFGHEVPLNLRVVTLPGVLVMCENPSQNSQ